MTETVKKETQAMTVSEESVINSSVFLKKSISKMDGVKLRKLKTKINQIIDQRLDILQKEEKAAKEKEATVLQTLKELEAKGISKNDIKNIIK